MFNHFTNTLSSLGGSAFYSSQNETIKIIPDDLDNQAVILKENININSLPSNTLAINYLQINERIISDQNFHILKEETKRKNNSGVQLVNLKMSDESNDDQQSFFSSLSNFFSKSPSNKQIKEPKDDLVKIKNLTNWDYDFPYQRPLFLKLNEDEIQASSNYLSRPVIIPKKSVILPFSAGYAEVINSYKTYFNEDQASAVLVNLFDNPINSSQIEKDSKKSFVYFAIFDGHDGAGASILAANHLHSIICEYLESLFDFINDATEDENLSFKLDQRYSSDTRSFDNNICADDLIIGSLELAFNKMDLLIEKELGEKRGGCAAIVALFFRSKLYIANAGDCRAVLYNGKNRIIQASRDHRPDAEKERLKAVCHYKPDLLKNIFTSKEFHYTPTINGKGHKFFYREPWMKGWFFKTLDETDVRKPIFHCFNGTSRLMCTLSLSRGLGDFNLQASNADINIKPFLSSVPEVSLFDLRNDKSQYCSKENNEDKSISFKSTSNKENINLEPSLDKQNKKSTFREKYAQVSISPPYSKNSKLISIVDTNFLESGFREIDNKSNIHWDDGGFLILGSDGLWDIVSNNEAVECVKKSISLSGPNNSKRYTIAAQDLLMMARGTKHNDWKTYDDITVFVIPLK